MIEFANEFRDENLRKEIFNDFNEKYGMDKIQVITLENICENNLIKVLNCEIDECEYFLMDLDITITQPFLEDSGRTCVNPFKEYKRKFEKSNFIKLIDIIKKNINENCDEDEIKRFIDNF